MANPEVHQRLPRGPHELTRDEVQQSQRQRILLAMADAVADKGYVKTSVADVLKRAGVSRATFYAQFDDKEDCFCAAFEFISSMLTQVLASQLRQATEANADLEPIDRVDAILGMYLDAMAQAPSFAKTFLIEVYAAGPVAVEQRRQSMEGFVDLVLGALEGVPLPGGEEDRRFMVQALVGGIGATVTNMVGAGETERLPEVREQFIKMIRHIINS